MKKKFLIMAIALFGIAGATASAQETTGNQARQETQVPQNKMRQPREFTEFAFEGILLDLNQQQRMDSLNAAVKANRPVKGEGQCAAADCKKDDCKKADCKKGDCKKGDCKKSDCKKGECTESQAQCMEAGKCQADGKECKKAGGECRGMNPKGKRMLRTPYGPEYVAKVKEILTPEQFEMFQENVTNMQTNMRKAYPGMKEGARAARMEKAGKNAAAKAKAVKANKSKASKETK